MEPKSEAAATEPEIYTSEEMIEVDEATIEALTSDDSALPNLDDESEKSIVKEEVEELREFVASMKIEEFKDGSWFERLLRHALSSYTTKVDAAYFREKYPDLPADAVVQERIEMAARYAAIEGGLTSAAYTGSVAATIGGMGGPSPLTVPAGTAAFAVDMAYLSQSQIKLAYDISVLYGIPFDLDDPDDLWNLVKIAFAVKVGEGAGSVALKGIPAVVRPFLKKYYSKGVLAAAKSLPVIGKHLLQRNVIKFAIPGVGVPLTVAVNYWTTKTSGAQAQNLLRSQARLIEAASRIANKSPQLVETIWAMWLTMNIDGTTSEDQHTLLHFMTVEARKRDVSEDDLESLRNLVDLDEDEVWAKLGGVEDLRPVLDAALIAAALDGRPNEPTLAVLNKLAAALGAELGQDRIDDAVNKWSTPSRKGLKKRHNKSKAKDGKSPAKDALGKTRDSLSRVKDQIGNTPNSLAKARDVIGSSDSFVKARDTLGKSKEQISKAKDKLSRLRSNPETQVESAPESDVESDEAAES